LALSINCRTRGPHEPQPCGVRNPTALSSEAVWRYPPHRNEDTRCELQRASSVTKGRRDVQASEDWATICDGMRYAGGWSILSAPLPRMKPVDPPFCEFDRAPPQLAHKFRQAAAGTCTSATLRNFQKVQDGLRADPLNAVVTDLSTETFETKLPWVYPRGNRSGSCSPQHFNEGFFHSIRS
jgi:hypothetical protein